MADTTVTVTVIMRAKAGYEERMRGMLKNMIEHSRMEEGCLQYSMYESMIYPLIFMLYMRWSDEAAFERHMLSSHVKAFEELHAKELLDGSYDLKRWLSMG